MFRLSIYITKSIWKMINFFIKFCQNKATKKKNIKRIGIDDNKAKNFDKKISEQKTKNNVDSKVLKSNSKSSWNYQNENIEQKGHYFQKSVSLVNMYFWIFPMNSYISFWTNSSSVWVYKDPFKLWKANSGHSTDFYGFQNCWTFILSTNSKKQIEKY